MLAEKQAAEEIDAETDEGDRITIDSAASPTDEERRRFLERLEANEAAMEERQGEKMEELDVPEEREAARLFERTFYEAYWLRITTDFPDGRPLKYQDRRRASFWAIWINAMDALYAQGVV